MKNSVLLRLLRTSLALCKSRVRRWRAERYLRQAKRIQRRAARLNRDRRGLQAALERLSVELEEPAHSNDQSEART